MQLSHLNPNIGQPTGLEQVQVSQSRCAPQHIEELFVYRFFPLFFVVCQSSSHGRWVVWRCIRANMLQLAFNQNTHKWVCKCVCFNSAFLAIAKKKRSRFGWLCGVQSMSILTQLAKCVPSMFARSMNKFELMVGGFIICGRATHTKWKQTHMRAFAVQRIIKYGF